MYVNVMYDCNDNDNNENAKAKQKIFLKKMS